MSNDSTTSNPEGADGASPLAPDAPSGEVNISDAAASDVASTNHDAPHGFDVSDVLAAVTKERDDFKDLALRLQADFENFRKRVTAQVTDDVDRAALERRFAEPNARLTLQLRAMGAALPPWLADT